MKLLTRAFSSSDQSSDALSGQAVVLLRRLVLVMLAAALANGANVVATSRFEPRNMGFVAIAIVAALCYRELLADRVNRGLAILCWGLWLSACVFSFMAAGIRTPILYILPVILMTTAWLQGNRATWWMTLGTIVHLGALTLADYQGWLPAPMVRTTLDLFLVYVSVAGLSSAVALTLAATLRLHLTKEQTLTRELRELNETLEARVAQRTQELASAKEEADAANRAKSIFLSNMSHELRTPLNAILGFAKLLARDDEIKHKSRKKLATINRAGLHLLTLINDVLEISRIEADRVVISRQPFDLADVLVSIEEMIRMRAEDKGLQFVVERTADLPRHVEGDGPHLKQILINILDNAVKYTEQGQVHLRVSCQDDIIVFAVADTGRGMSADEQLHLFHAFYQTESAIAQGEGTGLGLAISQQYAKLMSGRLAVESEPHKGSVFTLTIPLPETRTHVLAASTIRNVIGLEAGQEDLRILVVDDKEDNRELIRVLLESTGFKVRTANDGQQALLAFQNWAPCFIWMDVRMPVMDGYSATRNIRALPGGRNVKIVALTASVFEEDRAAANAAGCDEMTIKPVEEDRLFQVMGKLLDLRYRYSDELPMPVMPLQSQLDLSGLPAVQVAELKKAADALDLESVRGIIRQIGQERGEELASSLASLVDQFRFDRITDLCDIRLAWLGSQAGKMPADTPPHGTMLK